MINSGYHGTEIISFLRPKISDILPEKLKNIETLEVFKKEIKIWKLDNSHVDHVRFLLKA